MLELALPNCINVTDLSLLAAAKFCPKLQHLNLESVGSYVLRNLTHAMESVAAHCPLLESLNLAWCSTLRDSAIEAVARRCPGLKALNLWNCHALTSTAMRALGKAAGSVRHASPQRGWRLPKPPHAPRLPVHPHCAAPRPADSSAARVALSGLVRSLYGSRLALPTPLAWRVGR